MSIIAQSIVVTEHDVQREREWEDMGVLAVAGKPERWYRMPQAGGVYPGGGTATITVGSGIYEFNGEVYTLTTIGETVRLR